MINFRPIVILAVIAIFLAIPSAGVAQLENGVIEVNVKNVKVDGKPARLSRKRFYMFPGGLKENAALLQRIKAAEITSRNCYYKALKASDQYICWLQAENCESPFCRVVEARYIDASEKQHVPEFLTAYKRGMTLYRGKSGIAREWLLTNMPDDLVNGYYRQQQKVLATLLGGIKPLQSAMTDTAAVRTIFIDIPFPAGSKPKAKYLFTNVLPIEIGNKSYVWSCEKDVEAGKSVLLNLARTDRGCDVVERELRVCDTAPCAEAK
jgi:hypothetical protein